VTNKRILGNDVFSSKTSSLVIEEFNEGQESRASERVHTQEAMLFEHI